VPKYESVLRAVNVNGQVSRICGVDPYLTALRTTVRMRARSLLLQMMGKQFRETKPPIPIPTSAAGETLILGSFSHVFVTNAFRDSYYR
jgi:hypothetical protein